MADAPPPSTGGATPPAGGASPAAKPPAGGPSPATAAAAAQPNMQQIFMLAGRGMTPQMQQLFQNFRPPPMPPELADAFRKMQPQLEAARAAVLKPEVAAEMKRYQAEVAKLNPSAPDFAAQLEKIPKPNLQSLRLPEPSPEIKRMIQQWLLSAKSPQITAALEQAQQAQQAQQATKQATKQAQQTTKPAAKQAPKQQQQQQQVKPAPKQPPQAAAKHPPPPKQEQQQQQAAAKPPAPPPRQPSPAPQSAIPARARPRKPSPLGPLGAKASLPASATPGSAAAGADSAQATPAGAAVKPAGSSEEPEGPDATGIEVDVVCNGLKGTFLVDQQLMVCYCSACEERAEREGRRRTIVSPSEFERHAGAGQAKKWRWTVHTADDKQTLGDWLAVNNLDTRAKLGRSPFSTKQRKQAAEAADAEAEGREESEGPRLHLSGRSLPARRGRGKRKKSEEPDTDEDSELKEALGSSSEEQGGEPEEQQQQQRQKQRRVEPEVGPTQQAQQAQQAQRMEGLEQAEQAVSPLAPGPGGSGEFGGGASRSGGVQGQLQPSGGSGKHKRQLRWIRRSTASPEGSDDEQDGQAGKRQQPQQQQQPLQQVKQEAHEGALDGPLLLPMQRAAEATEAAAARQAAVAASAVGPRPLGLAPVVVPKRAAAGKGGRVGEEQPGLRSPTGKPWLAADHAFHEEHEGTDMRLGDAYQAHLPDFYGPLELLGEAAEAQEPLAALPGPNEAEALASAAGPEREQALSLPRDATADVWLREVADQVRATITGRQQRQRKQSRWLQETFDPNAVLGGKPLVERQFEEDNARDRFMLGRVSQRGGLLQELEAAAAAGAQPELLRWSLERIGDNSAGLGVRVSLGGVLFSGILAPMGGTASGGVTPHHRPLSTLLGEAAAAAMAGGAAEAATRGLQPAVSGISSEQPTGSRRAGQGTPAATGGLSLAGTGGRAPAAVAPLQWHEGESRPDAGAERRQQAEARFQALEAAGAPAGTKCALCHGTAVDDIDESSRGLGGRSPSGLGQMILVRVSAVSHAWVHDQCARWSPEVYDPEGTGHLEGVRDAVRRGRMLRCKYCGDKGATLGCFKLTCRASYHLACARKYQCLLQVDPYVVACPEHVNDLPAPYGNKPAKSRSGKRKPGAGSSGGRGKGRGSVAVAGRGRGGRGNRGSDSEDEDAVLEDLEDSEDEDEEMQEDEGDEGSQGGTEQLGGGGPESEGAAALLAQLQSLVGRPDNGRKAAPAASHPATAASLPLPIPVVPGAALAGAWTRERIVEKPALRAELAAEQAHGTKAVVVNFEETHFRFRSFHSAQDITDAVQADADAILVLDRSLQSAAQAWPRSHSFPSQMPSEQLNSFCNLLLKEWWKRLPADEQQRQLKQTTEQVTRQPQGAAAAAAGAPAAALATAVNPAAVAAGLAQALANPAGRAAIAARLAELAPSLAARPGAAAPAAAMSQVAPVLLSSILQQRGQPAPQGQQQQPQQQQQQPQP